MTVVLENPKMMSPRRFSRTVSSSKSIIISVVVALSVMVVIGWCLFIQSVGRFSAESFWAGFRRPLAQNIAMFNFNFGKHVAPDDQYLMSQNLGFIGEPFFCSKNTAVLKVFVYDLPPEFHFGMIEKTYGGHIWPQNMSEVPRYPGGLNMQHSIEYWLTLDLLSSAIPQPNRQCTAILVDNMKDADVFFVPFFSSLSYNKYTRSELVNGVDKNIQLQEKVVEFLHRQVPWRQSGGRNHVIVMHHPNSLHVAREQLRSAMFVVSDFGRYSPEVANVLKDIVAPYKHMVPTFVDDNSSFESRKTLLFFQGAIVRKEGGIIRQQLYEMLKDEPGVHFSTGSAQKDGIRSASDGMRSSKFCLHLAGDTPSSNRLFDAIVSHCVPVIISDDIELPYEDQLDYSEFSIFVRSVDALQNGFLLELLLSVQEEEWTQKWSRLKQIDHHFEYQYPTRGDDAVNMIWKSIARRLPSVKQSLHKSKRYSRSRLFNQNSDSRAL